MRGLAILAALMPTMALAGWQALSGDQIKQALTGRTVAYEAGGTQQFLEGGSTTYDSGKPQAGSWRIEGDQYCSVWPPSDHWACYGVEIDGDQIRFVASDGTATAGHYIKAN